MADKDSPSTLVAKIRERIVERAVNGAPHWTAPVENSARSTAGCLLVGLLLEKLPTEDASALCETLLAEQNDDGSWSSTMNEDGDLSLTLEVVEALSEARLPVTREALTNAVDWLQENQDAHRLDVETVLLLRSLTELPKSNTERVLGSGHPLAVCALETARIFVSHAARISARAKDPQLREIARLRHQPQTARNAICGWLVGRFHALNSDGDAGPAACRLKQRGRSL